MVFFFLRRSAPRGQLSDTRLSRQQGVVCGSVLKADSVMGRTLPAFVLRSLSRGYFFRFNPVCRFLPRCSVRFPLPMAASYRWAAGTRCPSI